MPNANNSRQISPRDNLSEIVIYGIIWLFILAEPISRHSGDLSLYLRDWVRDIPIFLLFLVNIFWLVPGMLFNKKIFLYIFLVLLLSIASTLIGELIFSFFQARNSFPPPDFHPGPHPPMPHFGPGPGMPSPGRIFDFGFFNQLLINLLIISLSTAIRVTVKWFKNEQARREIEKEFLKSELSFLQNQISPHFLMNTLNNIHALIDINGKNAQLAILKLSKMMRHLLYEPDGPTTLQKELEFLESYIDLMKLRVDESVVISLSIPVNYTNCKLPPLLLIPFIENAFKHGVSYKEKSYINISLVQDGSLIIFDCVNSLLKNTMTGYGNSGIGLKNVKKRLDLLYGEKYSLLINESDVEFLVKLTIPAYEN